MSHKNSRFFQKIMVMATLVLLSKPSFSYSIDLDQFSNVIGGNKEPISDVNVNSLSAYKELEASLARRLVEGLAVRQGLQVLAAQVQQVLRQEQQVRQGQLAVQVQLEQQERQEQPVVQEQLVVQERQEQPVLQEQRVVQERLVIPEQPVVQGQLEQLEYWRYRSNRSQHRRRRSYRCNWTYRSNWSYRSNWRNR